MPDELWEKFEPILDERYPSKSAARPHSSWCEAPDAIVFRRLAPANDGWAIEGDSR